MLNGTIVPTLEPFEMQIGTLLLFFFGCIFVVVVLSFCLFGQRAITGCQWCLTACSLRCCLKCCCPKCCKKPYKRLVQSASDWMERSAQDSSDEESAAEEDKYAFLNEINNV